MDKTLKRFIDDLIYHLRNRYMNIIRKLLRYVYGFCPICGYYENKKITTKFDNLPFTSCKNECINKDTDVIPDLTTWHEKE